jgi:hypothetical protein
VAHGDKRNLGGRKESVGGQDEDENQKSYAHSMRRNNGSGMAKAVAE